MKRTTTSAKQGHVRPGAGPQAAGGRPGGPKKQKTPWVRRIVSTLILLALLAGLIFALVTAVKWVLSVIGAEHERSTVSSLPQPVEILPCKPGSIDVEVTPSDTEIPEGAGFTVEVELLNSTQTECSFEVEDLDVSLSVGGYDVWTPTACKADDRTLLLASEQEWKTSFKWNGGVYVDCERVNLDVQDEAGKPIPATASSGVYDLVVGLSGAEEPVHLEIVVD